MSPWIMSKSCKVLKPRAISRIWKDHWHIREEQWMRRRVKARTDLWIWTLLWDEMIQDILARSPSSAKGETSKMRTSLVATLIAIENPWRCHNPGCPETAFQARNSRVNDWVKNKSTKCNKQARHTLRGSSSLLLSPDWSVKFNNGWRYRNIKIYLQNLRLKWRKNLDCHFFIVPRASKDCAKRAIPNR